MRRLTITGLTMPSPAAMDRGGPDEDPLPPFADAQQDVAGDYDPWQGFNEHSTRGFCWPCRK